ncbi:uncharacterized protein [Choristoneura fumiferana]|uniref:uncharacterized protein n=1 Tax=Choristoneura fumiferana TaxID=7141 RepID=UPI003D15CD4B
MFNTPANKILTRKQHREWELEQRACASAQQPAEPIVEKPNLGTYSCPPAPPPKDLEQMKVKTAPKSTPFTSVEGGSVTSSKSKRSTASAIARRKQLELEAAEAKAKIHLELINKKLEADLAKVDIEDCPSEIASQAGSEVADQASINVQKWLDQGYKEPQRVLQQPAEPTSGRPVEPSPQPRTDVPSDGIQQLALTLREMMMTSREVPHDDDRLISRLATPRELPYFTGDSIEWLHFKSAYDESTSICKFSDSENLWRLRKSLRGDAKEAVTDLLIGNTPPAAVMEALELRFGRPEVIILNLTTQLKKLPALPTTYHNNTCPKSARLLTQSELASAVLSKLPSTLIGKWTDFAYQKLAEGKPRLEILGTFLKHEAEMLSLVGMTQLRDFNKKPTDQAPATVPAKRTDENKFRSNRPIFTTTAVEDTKICKFCSKSEHLLTECRAFKRAMRRDKWRFVKKTGLCYCCLTSRHDRNTCPAPVCDIDKCGLAHHRLLHWQKPTSSQSADAACDPPHEQPEPPAQPPLPAGPSTVAHVASGSERPSSTDHVMLKVVSVQISGPNGIVQTYALLDDAASVSIIDSDLATELGLKSEHSSAIKFIDAFGLEVYQSDAPTNVHRSGIDWNCRIQPDEHTKWVKWLNELKLLATLRIPRCYADSGPWTGCYADMEDVVSEPKTLRTELHTFNDASIQAYAAVSYWRFIRTDGSVKICFVASKSRVTPLRPVSVPRLELQAGLLGARLASMIQREHKDVKADKRYFWTDSSTVLQWIRSDPRSYKPYVAHRLGEIDELTVASEWRHLPSRLNAADIATREDAPPLNFQDLWFQGPDFLKEPEFKWPKDIKTSKQTDEVIFGGRVDKTDGVPERTKRPVILDGHHRTTRLLVEYHHRRALHGAHELVVNELRQAYWILRLRPTVRAVAAQCLFCKYRRAAPQPQRMADLPPARLQHNRRPFTFTGLDFFGPMEVTVGRGRQKRYGMLFTCLTIRAVHVEITENLTTDATIMALRRMIARRGTPTTIYSDNGTNLRGADSEIKRSIEDLNRDALCSDGLVRGIDWRFIPPGAPEMGGAWERMVRSFKTALKIVLKERAPRPETLSTLMAEVEALVNSRPITHVSTDPNYPEALTPNHFLIGTSSNGPSFGKYEDVDLSLRKQWRIAQRLTDMFWSRWLKEYLPTLLPRQKWTSERRALRIGDYVLLVEPNLERGSWRHGVVSATLPGDDGRIRVVDVRTRTGTLRRPVTRVALLSSQMDSSDDCHHH